MSKSRPTLGSVARAKYVADRLSGESHLYRGFIHTNEAWYGKTSKSDRYVDEVMLGLYSTGGGTQGEMAVRWIDLYSKSSFVENKPPAPRLEAFDDSWKALASFADILEEMAKVDSQSITPKQFCNLLLRNGFKDLTERERKGNVA
jgi:hypothetical protein